MAENERVIMLLGKTGHGKSATGNTILKRDVFEKGTGFSARSRNCKQSKNRPDNMLQYLTIDTPGLFYADEKLEECALEILQEGERINGRLHVFVLVLSGVSNMTTEEKHVVDILEKIFGPKMFEHTIIVFTHGSKYNDTEVLIEKAKNCNALKELINKCSNRVFRIENSPDETEQNTEAMREELLQSIEDVSCKGTRSYKSDSLTSKEDLKRFLQRYNTQGDTSWNPMVSHVAAVAAGVAALFALTVFNK